LLQVLELRAATRRRDCPCASMHGAEAEAGDEATDEEEDACWACLSTADVDADLAESAQAAATPVDSRAAAAEEDELRLLLKQKASAGTAGFNGDVFFSTNVALKHIYAQLQGALVKTETVQLDAAAVIASIQQGPLRPPVQAFPLDSAHAAKLRAGRLFSTSGWPVTTPTPSLAATLPAAATGFAEYQQLLAGLSQDLFVERPLRLCAGDVNRYQDRKDISRDELIVNGRPVSGAKGGYEAALQEVCAGLRAADDAWPSEEAEKRAGELFLSVLNRTSSGFAAIEEVLRVFNCPAAVIVSPESAKARPLEAMVLEGVALGRAHTRYSVLRSDASGDPLAVIDATFVFRVGTATLRRLAMPVEKENLAMKLPDGGPDAGATSWPVEEARAVVLLSRQGK